MLADLRAAVVARLTAAQIVPVGAVYSAHMAATPPTVARSLNVSVPEVTGRVGPGAGYACDAEVALHVECVARGAADTATADAVDAMAWLVLRALLIDPTFRDQWPLAGWKDELSFLPEASRSCQVRVLRLAFRIPVDFTTVPTDALLEVGASFDLDNPTDGEPEVEDTIEVGA